MRAIIIIYGRVVRRQDAHSSFRHCLISRRGCPKQACRGILKRNDSAEKISGLTNEFEGGKPKPAIAFTNRSSISQPPRCGNGRAAFRKCVGGESARSGPRS